MTVELTGGRNRGEWREKKKTTRISPNTDSYDHFLSPLVRVFATYAYYTVQIKARRQQETITTTTNHIPTYLPPTHTHTHKTHHLFIGQSIVLTFFPFTCCLLFEVVAFRILPRIIHYNQWKSYAIMCLPQLVRTRSSFFSDFEKLLWGTVFFLKMSIFRMG